MIIENESDYTYIVFVDGQRTDKKIANGRITLPDTAEKMIIVPDITNLPADGGYVMLFSEIDLTTAAKDGEEYVATSVGEKFLQKNLRLSVKKGQTNSANMPWTAVSKSIISTKKENTVRNSRAKNK